MGFRQNKKKAVKTVTVGIAAFNEEGTILKTLKSILAQKENNYNLKKIMVVSDNSSDKTNRLVSSIKDPRVELVINGHRVGKSQILETIFSKTTSDIVIIFDADVVLATKYTISNLVAPFYLDKKIGLVGGDRLARKVNTFWGKSVQTSVLTYDRIKLLLKDGSNPYSCHGCILALSRNFIKSLNIPSGIFSDDTYLYFSCISLGFLFKNAPKAKVWFNLPETLTDAFAQYKRFLNMDSASEQQFRDLIKREYQIPTLLKYKILIEEFLKNPLYSLTMHLIKIYCLLYGKYIQPSKALWQMATSTKKEGLSNAR